MKPREAAGTPPTAAPPPPARGQQRTTLRSTTPDGKPVEVTKVEPPSLPLFGDGAPPVRESIHERTADDVLDDIEREIEDTDELMSSEAASCWPAYDVAAEYDAALDAILRLIQRHRVLGVRK